jgi:hypothetical protein
VEVYELLVNEEYYGKLEDEQLKAFISKMRSAFPMASLFKSDEEEQADRSNCIQNLTLSVSVEISDKVATLSVK